MTNPTEPVTLAAEVPFYLSRDNQIYGPHHVGEIQELLDAEVISPGDMIWMEGWEGWQALGTVFELEPTEAAAPVLEAPAEVAPEAPVQRVAPEAKLGVGKKAPVEKDAALLSSLPGGETPEEDEDGLAIAREPLDRSSRRFVLGITAAVLAHLALFLTLAWLAPVLFRIEPYPAPAAPTLPPIEVSLVPEEPIVPPTPAPPAPVAETPPPPPVEPPPPPAPPIISMPTPPPPPMPALASMPDPPPVTDMPVQALPQHVSPQPRKVAARPVAAPVQAPTQVRDAGPSDYLYAPPPEYPPYALQHRQTGAVILRVVVSEGGDPTDVQIQQSSGYRVLDQAALTQVRDTYRFRVGNSRILLVPIRFQL